MLFLERTEAGRQLTCRLDRYRDATSVVLAIPRGGTRIGYEIARALGLPLDVLVSRRLKVPGVGCVDLGAIAERALVLDRGLLRKLRLHPARLRELVTQEAMVMQGRSELYRRGEPALPIEGRNVILVEDGRASTAMIRAAVDTVRKSRPARVVLAAPVCSTGTLNVLRGKVDAIVTLYPPSEFGCVVLHDQHFKQTTETDVSELIAETRGINSQLVCGRA